MRERLEGGPYYGQVPVGGWKPADLFEASMVYAKGPKLAELKLRKKETDLLGRAKLLAMSPEAMQEKIAVLDML